MTHRRLDLRSVSLCLVAVLLPGCVPVTEPLSDLDKAKPDERLIGKWKGTSSGAADCEIDIPTVKGNPKGLMRSVCNGRVDDPLSSIWFFTTTIGKHTYANFCLEATDKKGADFRNEGAFEKWNKGDNRGYFIVRYILDEDKLTMDGGDGEAMKQLMESQKIEGQPFFKTPPGWLAKYLEASGPATLFNGTNVQERQRQKK